MSAAAAAAAAAPVTVAQYLKTERELHKLYRNGSDLYRKVYDRQGCTIGQSVADKLARSHSTTLESLIDEGLTAYPGPSIGAESPRYGTAHIFEALGY